MWPWPVPEHVSIARDRHFFLARDVSAPSLPSASLQVRQVIEAVKGSSNGLSTSARLIS